MELTQNEKLLLARIIEDFDEARERGQSSMRLSVPEMIDLENLKKKIRELARV